MLRDPSCQSVFRGYNVKILEMKRGNELALNMLLES